MSFTLDPKLDADTIPLVEWGLSSVRLMNDCQYPWLILIPRRGNMRDLIDLAPSDRHQLNEEIDQATRVLKSLTDAHKMNVASLGNVVEQLHVHVIARQTDDAAWPGPVWGVHPPKPYDANAMEGFVTKLCLALQTGV